MAAKAHSLQRMPLPDNHSRLLAQRRKYNRKYMRRWRANPKNQRRERLSRRGWLETRKIGRVARRTGRVCGFCHLRAARSEVIRLRPAANGFVEVRMLYCGQC
jgi:hypothetical protein